MKAKSAATFADRAEHVHKVARVYATTLQREIFGPKGIELLEDFAKKAEDLAHTKSRELQAHLSKAGRDLTNHAAHMRSVAAHIVLLRDGLVPAIKIDKDNEMHRANALASMTFLLAQFQAMDIVAD